jgi:hypothetical protein
LIEGYIYQTHFAGFSQQLNRLAAEVNFVFNLRLLSSGLALQTMPVKLGLDKLAN